ncbi:MAG: pyruvate, phosphate dikinase [Rhizobiaceae bacterium]
MSDLPFFSFGLDSEAHRPDIPAMGAKGAGLVAMHGIGLPVPPGFILGTALGAKLAGDAAELSDDVLDIVQSAVVKLEQATGRTFGGVETPLLLSVRSGASASMPGMMDTVLDLGLNKQTVEALAKETGDGRFAWDSYRRFIQSFSQVVLELDDDPYEMALEDMRERCGVEADSDLPAEALKKLAGQFLEIVEGSAPKPFPQDVTVQLSLALVSVFKSWNTRRAQTFREMNGISHEDGTAATVQAMVFGNRDERSCSGVYFTRNPSTGANKPYGEYIANAQGEDVVSGVRTPMELTEESRLAAMSENPSMEKLLPEAYAQLLEAGETLETHFGDMQEIEFTVESGRLYLLQTRTAKRNPKAALRVAVEMARDEMISKAAAVSRCTEEMLAPMLVVKADPSGVQLFAKGLPASPGAVSGEIAFTSDTAIKAAEAGRSAILVRPETDPRDVHGMNAACGILTSRGGMTSHAAVVARGMGKPCITAAMGLKIDTDAGICSSAGQTLQAGDTITIDGGTGMAYPGELPVVKPKPDGDLATLLEWKTEADN